VRTLPKQEHIAAAWLRGCPGIEVFLPRVRFRRATRSGPAWVTEALFASYLFARFELSVRLRQVQAARGVRAVVHFGSRWPAIPDTAIAELRAATGDQDLILIPDEFRPGDEAEIAGGILHGLQAVVTRAMPGRRRVAVLLEFLGRQTAVELDRNFLVHPRPGSR
jgi:transcriptional antiterminator RfaH